MFVFFSIWLIYQSKLLILRLVLNEHYVFKVRGGAKEENSISSTEINKNYAEEVPAPYTRSCAACMKSTEASKSCTGVKIPTESREKLSTIKFYNIIGLYQTVSTTSPFSSLEIFF